MIIDCFPFYNELDLLDIRLHELAGVVDLTILVEAAETHSGDTKPFHFETNSGRFGDFKVCRVQVAEFPAGLSRWERAAFQREAIGQALQAVGAKPEDLVMVSDADEIPSAGAVAHAAALLNARSNDCLVFSLAQHYYYLNRPTGNAWLGTRMARFEGFAGANALHEADGAVLPGAGWQFGKLGGASRIQESMASFGAAAASENLLASGMEGRAVRLDGSYPRYLLDNALRFAGLIQQDESWQCLSLAEAMFRQAAHTPCDINEHLPYLNRLASTVNHVTELGTRSGYSASAFLAAKPARLLCYDLSRDAIIDHLERAAEEVGVDFHFYEGDDLAVELEATDLLFIDTWHVEQQMEVELRLHADKARKYLVLHDTESFAHCGETAGHGGIWPAVANYMRSNPQWSLLQHFPNNNGLTVFVRTG